MHQLEKIGISFSEKNGPSQKSIPNMGNITITHTLSSINQKPKVGSFRTVYEIRSFSNT